MEISEIVAFCDKFFQKYHTLTTADNALGVCEYVSKKFCEMFPELNAKPLYLKGHRNIYPNRHSYWNTFPNPDECIYHVVVNIDDQIIDLSYKQFDATWPKPYKITPVIEFKEDWLAIANHVNITEILRNKGDFFQITRSYLKKSCCTSDEAVINEHRLERWNYFITSYIRTQKAIIEGNLILTGTEQNNHFLSFFKQLKRCGIENTKLYKENVEELPNNKKLGFR